MWHLCPFWFCSYNEGKKYPNYPYLGPDASGCISTYTCPHQVSKTGNGHKRIVFNPDRPDVSGNRQTQVNLHSATHRHTLQFIFDLCNRGSKTNYWNTFVKSALSFTHAWFGTPILIHGPRRVVLKKGSDFFLIWSHFGWAFHCLLLSLISRDSAWFWLSLL